MTDIDTLEDTLEDWFSDDDDELAGAFATPLKRAQRTTQPDIGWHDLNDHGRWDVVYELGLAAGSESAIGDPSRQRFDIDERGESVVDLLQKRDGSLAAGGLVLSAVRGWHALGTDQIANLTGLSTGRVTAACKRLANLGAIVPRWIGSRPSWRGRQYPVWITAPDWDGREATFSLLSERTQRALDGGVAPASKTPNAVFHNATAYEACARLVASGHAIAAFGPNHASYHALSGGRMRPADPNKPDGLQVPVHRGHADAAIVLPDGGIWAVEVNKRLSLTEAVRAQAEALADAPAHRSAFRGVLYIHFREPGFQRKAVTSMRKALAALPPHLAPQANRFAAIRSDQWWPAAHTATDSFTDLLLFRGLDDEPSTLASIGAEHTVPDNELLWMRSAASELVSAITSKRLARVRYAQAGEVRDPETLTGEMAALRAGWEANRARPLPRSYRGVRQRGLRPLTAVGA